MESTIIKEIEIKVNKIEENNTNLIKIKKKIVESSLNILEVDDIEILETIRKIDIKYPTFDDQSIESQLKSEVTYESLIFDLNSCDEVTHNFCLAYDNLFLNHKNGEFIIEKLKEHNMNFIAYKIFVLILNREVTLIYYLLKKKFTKNEDEKEKFYKILKEDFIEKDIEGLVNDIIEKNKNYFKNDAIDDEEKTNIIQILQALLKNEKSLIEFEISNDKFIPSICSLNLTLKVMKSVLDEISNQINEILCCKDIRYIAEENFIKYFHNCNRIEILVNYFLLAYKIPHDDLFNLPENSEEWEDLKKHFERKVIFSRHVLKKKLQNVYNMVILGNASVSKGHNQFTNNFSKILGTGWYFAYFFFNKKKANIQNIKFTINPNYDIAQKVWNLMDVKGLKNILKLTMPSVRYSKKWYFKRTEEEINLGTIKHLIEIIKNKAYMNIKTPDEILMENYYDKIMDEYEINESQISVKSEDINNSGHTNIHKINSSISLYLKNISDDLIKDYIKVRIINYRDFYVPNNKTIWNIFSCCNVERNFNSDSLIIHIHGGGFIAMSASSHENYTRKWTNKLEVPVFSIDYRLAPENPYPRALDDVYQAYMWIVKYAEDTFKMNVKKIILVGDSAGGNLVLALTYLLILKKKRLPTAILLAYPALRIQTNNISCSFLNVLYDQILPYHLVKFCLESYRKDYDNEEDPFISPLLMDTNIIKLLPPVRIILGSSDPLRDDSFLFLKKLIDLKKDAKLVELKYFPHGFLNYDYPLMMPEASHANDILIEEMKKILENDNYDDKSHH